MSEETPPSPVPKRPASILRRLMLAALGLLGAYLLIMIALFFPVMKDLPHKAAEGAMRSGLKALRGAVSDYRLGHGQTPPDSLEALAGWPPFTQEFPALWKGPGPFPHTETRSTAAGSEARDTGLWTYVADKRDERWGQVFIDCTHTDARGTAWSAY